MGQYRIHVFRLAHENCNEFVSEYASRQFVDGTYKMNR
jgi:hypothetical protein